MCDARFAATFPVAAPSPRAKASTGLSAVSIDVEHGYGAWLREFFLAESWREASPSRQLPMDARPNCSVTPRLLATQKRKSATG